MRIAKIFFLILLSGAAYSNSFDIPFIFDDYPEIVDNTIIHNLENFYFNTSGLHYNFRRFFGYLSFAFNYRIGGLEVFGYHLFNLCVHLSSAMLVYTLVHLTFRTPYFQVQAECPTGHGSRLSSAGLESNAFHALIPFFAALFFVSHPVQTQAVVYIVQRLTSLATFFYLLSLVLYVLARLRQEAVPTVNQSEASPGQGLQSREMFSWRQRMLPFLLLTGSFLSAILAMMTKEMAFTLPFAVLLHEFCFFRGALKERLLFMLPLLLTVLIVPLSVLMTTGTAGELLSDVSERLRAHTDLSRTDYLFTQFRVIVTYLRLLILPVNQNLDYDYPVYTTFFTPPVFLSFMVLLAIFTLAMYLFWKTRPIIANVPVAGSRITDHSSRVFAAPELRLIAFGILWFFLALSVESSLIPIADVIFEHRLYLPSIGLFVAFSTLTVLLAGGRRRILFIGAAAIVLALAVATWHRNNIWRDPVVLWQDVASKSPHKARPYINLGAIYGELGRMEEAVNALSTAVQLAPSDAKAYANLGAALASLGYLDEASRALSRSVAIEPGDADILNNLGIVFKDTGRLNEAITALNEATRLDPNHAKAWYNLGRAYLSSGHTVNAESALRRALLVNPDYDNALVELATLLNRVGRNSEVTALLLPANRRLASRADARLVLGMAWHCLGEKREAERELVVLRKLDPLYASQLQSYMMLPCCIDKTSGNLL